MRGGDGASTDVPIAPRDASDGRVSGLVFIRTAFFRQSLDVLIILMIKPKSILRVLLVIFVYIHDLYYRNI